MNEKELAGQQKALEQARARLERKVRQHTEATQAVEKWSAKARHLGDEIATLHREIQTHTEALVGLGGRL